MRAIRRRPRRSGIATLIPVIWLVVFFLLPFLIVFKISLSAPTLAQPPYVPTFDSPAEFLKDVRQLSFANYLWLAENALYWKAALSSLGIAGLSAVITLLIGFPIAYGMARAPRVTRPILLTLVILPFWTSFLIRVYAWIGILRPEGLLNQFLLYLGVIAEPLAISNTDTAVVIGIVYSYLPFMVLPLYASLERHDASLLEAASDLGAPPLAAFWQVTAPLALPGVAAGLMLVFIPAVGEFVIPDLLGGSDTLMIGRTLWNEFFQNRDWPVASAVAILLLVLLVAPIIAFQNAQARLRESKREAV